MVKVKIYKHIENRIKILGLSYTALKFLIFPLALSLCLLFGGLASGSVLILLISLFFAGISYGVIYLLDSSRFLISINDEKLPNEIINDPILDD